MLLGLFLFVLEFLGLIIFNPFISGSFIIESYFESFAFSNSSINFCFDTILFLSKTGNSAIEVKKAFFIFILVFAETSKNNNPSLPANFSPSLVSTFLLIN